MLLEESSQRKIHRTKRKPNVCFSMKFYFLTKVTGLTHRMGGSGWSPYCLIGMRECLCVHAENYNAPNAARRNWTGRIKAITLVKNW